MSLQQEVFFFKNAVTLKAYLFVEHLQCFQFFQILSLTNTKIDKHGLVVKVKEILHGFLHGQQQEYACYVSTNIEASCFVYTLLLVQIENWTKHQLNSNYISWILPTPKLEFPTINIMLQNLNCMRGGGELIFSPLCSEKCNPNITL